MASQDLQRKVLSNQLDKLSSKSPFQGTHASKNTSSLAVSNGEAQVDGKSISNPALLDIPTTMMEESLRPKGTVNSRLQNATTQDGCSCNVSGVETAIQKSPRAKDRRLEGEYPTRKTGRFWPIQRVWQITPQLTETIKIGGISPMARWELESIKEESWNCVGEVFIDHPIDWSQEPEDYEDDEVDDEDMEGLGA